MFFDDETVYPAVKISRTPAVNRPAGEDRHFKLYEQIKLKPVDAMVTNDSYCFYCVL